MPKQNNNSVFVLVTVVSILVISGALLFSPAITGFAAVGAGETTALGVTDLINPEYGIVKGAVNYVILDADGHVAERSSPKKDLSLYLAPQDVEIDWSKDITCGPADGTLSWVDPDDSGGVCWNTNWYGTTSNCEAMDTSGKNATIYKLNTFETANNGPGCFAAKIPSGDYNLYAK